MNTRRTIVLASAILIASLLGCGTAQKEPPPLQASRPTDPPAVLPGPPKGILPDTCAAARLHREELEDLRSKYNDQHPDVIRQRRLTESLDQLCADAKASGPMSGKWRKQDDIIACDGYMTRSADQDYCSDDVPEDWIPFTFDGQQYYLQPLAHDG